MDKPCFELKGSLFTLSVLQLFDDNLSLLETQLQERIKMAPAFFNHTPFVIDLHELPEDKQELDFLALRQLLQSLSIIPVGVKGADKSLYIKLEAAGMAVLAEAKTPHNKPPESSQKQADERKAETEHEAAPSHGQEQEKTETQAPPEKQSPQKTTQNQANRAAKIVRQTIRSGQQIYAPGGDLVVIGSVSAGAEILADGNIHIYGTLRGRALAGVQGNQAASVFCRSLQAELISIAGIYLLSDDIPEDKIGASVQIHLKNEKLQMESI